MMPHQLAKTLFMLSAMLLAPLAVSQAQDLELDQSTSGQQAYEEFLSSLQALESSYKAELERNTQRFIQISEMRVKQYLQSMERELRELTRQGDLNTAKHIQTLTQAIGKEPIRRPGADGRYFLSNYIVEVPDSEKATSLGKDLQKKTQLAVDSFQRQDDLAFKAYQSNVTAARRGLRAALGRVKNAEQRAARLEAVVQVQDAIQAIDAMPPVQRPKESRLEAEADGARPVNMRSEHQGFFNCLFLNRQTNERYTALIKLSRNGCYSLSRHVKSRNVDPWDLRSVPMELLERHGVDYVFHFTEPDGREIVLKINPLAEEDPETNSASIKYWDSLENYRSGRPGTDSFSIRLGGYSLLEQTDLEDGHYVLDLHQIVNREGQEEGDIARFKVEILNGTMIKTMENYSKDPDQWKLCTPVVFRFMTKNPSGKKIEDIGLYADKRITEGRDLTDTLYIFMKKSGKPTVNYWWKNEWIRDKPSLLGGMIRVDD